jgi:glycosyltransferase involved in cell wall biosynthesis
VVLSLNTVDMEFFRHHAERFRRSPEFLAQRALYPELLLLSVGSLIPRKNVRLLLEALHRLSDPTVGLLVVGTGPQEKELRGLCRQLGLEGRVVFAGFRQQWELPQYYGLADVLVLPSLREVWGLVVNEALATGLYVLCSTAVGAAYDLVRPGWNGELFAPTAMEELVELLSCLRTRLPELRARREAISAHACREFSIERAAEGFLEGIHEAWRRARRG